MSRGGKRTHHASVSVADVFRILRHLEATLTVTAAGRLRVHPGVKLLTRHLVDGLKLHREQVATLVVQLAGAPGRACACGDDRWRAHWTPRATWLSCARCRRRAVGMWTGMAKEVDA